MMLLGWALAVSSCAKREKPAPDGAAAAPAAPPAAPTPSPLVTDKALVDGHLVRVTHSKWDGGQSADLFDTDPKTLARTENANPAVLEFELPTPRPLKSISITMGGANFKLDVVARSAGGGPEHRFVKEFRGLGPDPTLTLDFDTGQTPIASLRAEILDLDGGDGHIHIRTVKLQ
jgi:hypothetical protein